MNRSLSALLQILPFIVGFLSAADAVTAATATATTVTSTATLPRPRVLMTPEKLAAFREEIEEPGWKRDVYLRTVRANADLWVDRDIRIPARSGWIMDLVCTDGTMLAIPENQDFGTTTTYHCPACGTVYRCPRFEAARRRLEHEWLMAAARDLAMAGVLENAPRYLRRSAAILLDYANARFRGHAFSPSSGIFKHSLNDAVAIIWLAQAYDILASTGILPPESIHYHFYALQAFIEYAEAAANCGTDLYRFEARPGQRLHAMFSALLSFMYLDIEMPAINDGFVTGSIPFDQYEAAWARYGDPGFGWLLKQRPLTLTQRARTPSAIRALVHGDPLTENQPTPRFTSTNFANLGTCVLRNDPALPHIPLVQALPFSQYGHDKREQPGRDRFTLDGVSVPRHNSAQGTGFHYLTDLNTYPPTDGAIHAQWRFPDGSGLSAVTAPGDGTEVRATQELHSGSAGVPPAKP